MEGESAFSVSQMLLSFMPHCVCWLIFLYTINKFNQTTQHLLNTSHEQQLPNHSLAEGTWHHIRSPHAKVDCMGLSDLSICTARPIYALRNQNLKCKLQMLACLASLLPTVVARCPVLF